MRNDVFWSTVPVEPAPSDVWWKKSLGEACPHGNEFFIVHGSYVRNTYSSDFIAGDNGYHSPRFVPKNELWIDGTSPEAEWPFVAFHECHEAEDMKNGDDYETAHDKAQKLEDKFRRLHRPGE